MLYSIVWGKGRPCAGPFLLQTRFLLQTLYASSDYSAARLRASAVAA
jgi:hypothetical protein